MLFVPRERAKKTLERLHEEGKEHRRKQTIKERKAYLKAKEEGKLDEYYENLSKNWIIFD